MLLVCTFTILVAVIFNDVIFTFVIGSAIKIVKVINKPHREEPYAKNNNNLKILQ